MVLPLLTPPPPPVIGKKNVGIVVSKFRPPTPSGGRENSIFSLNYFNDVLMLLREALHKISLICF